MHSLERLFKPTSLAVVGASTDPRKAGYQMLYALQRFPGELYPINPKADVILGFPVLPNLEAIGKPVDLVILTIPAVACVKALQQAGEIGAGAALIIGGGFAETGGTGRRVQQDLLAVCRQYGIRLLGPNTSGFVNPGAGLAATFSSWISTLPAGGIGLISQSGAMNLILAALTATQGLGISLAVGIGNGADVDIPEALEYLAADDTTRVIMLYLEGVRQGRRLFEVIRRTTARKPVLILTVGQGDIGAFAASHTGNLIGSYAIKRAALQQAGAVLIDSSETLVDAANLLSRVRLAAREDPAVGLLTGQAGPAMVIADYLRSNNVRIPELHPDTVGRIQQFLPPLTFVRNPVDTGRPEASFPKVLQAVAGDPGLDVLITYALHEPATMDPVAVFRELKPHIRQPLIFGTAGFPENIEPVREGLAELDIASFPSPSRTAKAALALVEDARAAHRKNLPQDIPEFGVKLDPLQETPDEAAAKEWLSRIGIASPRHFVCRTHEEAHTAFENLAKPCVVKVLDPAITHKTEAGGVFLNIASTAQLSTALQRLDAIGHGDSRRYLLEETAAEGVEIIIGATRDPGFGPAVLLGLGGTAAEALGDITMRLAPLSLAEAEQMLSELKGRALLQGWRGAPAPDRRQIAATLVKIGRLMTDHPEIAELDLNPVRVYPQGLLVLDALIVVRP